MIHYHECKRCTHQWTSACFDHMGMDDKQLERRSRQIVSSICHDCFDMLEAGEIEGLAVFNLYAYLNRKADQIDQAGRIHGRFVHQETYSGMCHEWLKWENGELIHTREFESGITAELKQLYNIRSEINGVYLDIIGAQRTEKRIELDNYLESLQPTQGQRVGWLFCGNTPRPPGFVGDPPGKPRTQLLFGLDPKTGDLLAPHIVMQDGDMYNGGLKDSDSDNA